MVRSSVDPAVRVWLKPPPLSRDCTACVSKAAIVAVPSLELE
jgi:hypothetical protein